MSETHACPICRNEVVHHVRYPHQVCAQCAAKTSDAYGRRLKFSSDGPAGGLRAVYLDNGQEYNRQLCYIDGRKCFVNEHRFGGVVVEIVRG
jgi:hypothetical protein